MKPVLSKSRTLASSGDRGSDEIIWLVGWWVGGGGEYVCLVVDDDDDDLCPEPVIELKEGIG